jgi:hypothetical protein
MVTVDMTKEAGERSPSIGIGTKEVNSDFGELLDHALECRHFVNNDLSKPVDRSQPECTASHPRGKEM